MSFFSLFFSYLNVWLKDLTTINCNDDNDNKREEENKEHNRKEDNSCKEYAKRRIKRPVIEEESQDANNYSPSYSFPVLVSQ